MRVAAVRARLVVKAGACGAFLGMMRALQARGHQVDIFVLQASRELAEETARDFRVEVSGYETLDIAGAWPGPRILVDRLRALPHLRKLAAELREGGYDVVFVDHYKLATMLLPLLRGVRTAFYCHEPPRRYYDTALLKRSTAARLKYAANLPFYCLDRRIDAWLARRAGIILTNSDFERECIWRAYGVLAHTVRQGVDARAHRPLAGVGKEGTVLSVGVAQVHKGHDFVVRSLALLPPDIRPRLVIVSYDHDPRYVKELERLARSSGVELEVRGYVDDREFARLHTAARLEALGVIMEPSHQPTAFAYGLPIVAVREGGVREAVRDGVTGLLTGRVEAEFAAAVESLLRDPERAEKMGLAGRHWLEESFTWEACGVRLEKLLEGP
jgi:glycosyltransferase involved in cell wall biosynthesis